MAIYVFAAIYVLIGIGFSARNYDSDSRYGQTVEFIGACVEFIGACLLVVFWPSVIGALLCKALRG